MIVRDPEILAEERLWARWSVVHRSGQDNEPLPLPQRPVSSQEYPREWALAALGPAKPDMLKVLLNSRSTLPPFPYSEQRPA
jgi:hypothetical protein